MAYLFVATDVARRWSWLWNEKGDHSYAFDKAETRFLTWCVCVACLPLGIILWQAWQSGGNHGWDKPPRNIRAAEKSKSLKKELERVERENERLERILELN